VSKIDTEVDVKIACPLGRRRREMPLGNGRERSRVKKIAGYGGGFEGESEFPSDMRGPQQTRESGQVK
jgi:hypothetical protein